MNRVLSVHKCPQADYKMIDSKSLEYKNCKCSDGGNGKVVRCHVCDVSMIVPKHWKGKGECLECCRIDELVKRLQAPTQN